MFIFSDFVTILNFIFADLESCKQDIISGPVNAILPNSLVQWIFRAVIKRRGRGFPPAAMDVDPPLLSWENKRKIEPKETPSCFIPNLLVVFTSQLEVTSLVFCHWASEFCILSLLAQQAREVLLGNLNCLSIK